LRPANTDREYVLRRLIRRAARHGRNLRIFKPFLAEVCDGVAEAMGAAYPEIVAARDEVRKVVSLEEERFGETLDRGLDLLYPEIRRLQQTKARDGGEPVLSGEIAFKLYDTFGFPLDMMEADLRNEGLTLDRAGFDRLMEEQRERARAARKEDIAAPEIALGAGLQSQFVNGHSYEGESEILAAHRDNEVVTVVTAETPFYPEGGGQVGDRGVIESESGGLLEIFDTRKRDGSILHFGRILRGDPAEFERGRRVILRIDRARRDAAMRNHSATHLLHYALREIRGTQVHQAGSLVEPGRLRFDFNHPGPIDQSGLVTIEDEINARIRENAAVTTEEMPYDEALKAGALAFFGDKYGDRVRVVRMGDFSIELCGGTHVNRTGDIGLFKLEAESGIAAGVRRIEALTGAGALAAIRARETILIQLGGQLGASDAQMLERLARIQAREKELERKLRALEQRLNSGEAEAGAAEQVRQIKGVTVVTRKLEGVDARVLREIADRLREKYRSAVVALGSDLGDDKVALLVAVTADLTDRIKAGEIIKRIAPMVAGSGGGRAELAQAGGRDPSRIADALEQVATIVGDGP
jgi:alanyl-tRNA synthetase